MKFEVDSITEACAALKPLSGPGFGCISFRSLALVKDLGFGAFESVLL